MFEWESYQEILDTVRKNKLRTLLTGFAVAWGIFMLVLLLGAGRGLANGIHYQFRDDAINAIAIDPGTTSKPYAGLPEGREIRLDNRDFQTLTAGLAGLEYATVRRLVGMEVPVHAATKRGSYMVRGVHPDHLFLERSTLAAGRYLNANDLQARRKVAVIGVPIAAQLFGRRDPIGQLIQVDGTAYRVVGVFDDAGGEGETRMIYLPITTVQLVHGGGESVDRLMFTVGNADVRQSLAMEQRARALLARNHHFDPDDEDALDIYNGLATYRLYMNLYRGIEIFIWLVGLGTLIAGVVGVSNIMLIAVKERTREIGLRKALGASPNEIVALFLQESVLLTLVAGLLGLAAGIGLLRAIDLLMDSAALQGELFRNPGVNTWVALAAVLVLVIAGALAGWVPARRAAAVDPIAALREEA